MTHSVDPAITLRGVRVSIAGQDIVRDVDASLRPGTWTCLVGPNGAGKTTVLRVLIGAQSFHGEVVIHGEALDARGGPHERCAFVAQRPAVPAGMRVGEYVELGRFGAVTRRFERAHNNAVAQEVIERLHLASARHRPLSSMSGGELQLCAIARALTQQTPVIILDEPTSALDLHRQPAVMDLLDEHRRTHGTTIVSTTHDLTLAAMYADEFIVMDRGTVVDQGSTGDVCAREALARAFNHNIEVLTGPSGTPVVLPKRR